ncbi:MAG: soluble cytochrome b562, partial [Myxococcota bacterium]
MDALDPFDRIGRFLGATRAELSRVARRETVFAVILVTITTALVTLGAALLLDKGQGPWAFILAIAGAGAIAWAVWVFWIKPKRRRASDERLALWVEQNVDGLQSGVITSVQVRALIATPTPGFAQGLAVEGADRAAQGLAAVRPRSLMDYRRAKQLGFATLAAVAVAATVTLLFPAFWSDGARQLVTFPVEISADTGRIVSVATGPLDLKVVPPTYTAMQPRSTPRSTGDVEALAGSRVEFSGTVLYPARAAALILESQPNARWPVTYDPGPEGAGGTIRGQLRVEASDRYQFMLEDSDGIRISEKAWRNVDVRPDMPPEVRMLLPEADVEVIETDNVAFFFEGTDDFGIHSVVLVALDAEGEELLRTVVSSPAGERLSRGDHTIAVQSLGLEPGEAAEVFFEARDLNDLSGPGEGRSASRRLTIYSPEAEHKRLLASLEALMEAMIDNLADRLELPPEEQSAFRLNEYVRVMTPVVKKTEGVIVTLTELVQGFSTDPLATDGLKGGVLTVRNRLQDAWQQESAHLRKTQGRGALAGDKVMVALLNGANDEVSTELTNGVLAIKDLLDQSRKDRILEAGRELLETQNEMMELLKDLKDNKDPKALEAALKKLRKLQEKLQQLKQELAALNERTPYENQNMPKRPSDRQREMQDLGSTMDQIEKLLKEGKIDEAMALLEELNKGTQEMMASLEEDLDSGGGGSQSASRKAQELATKLDEIADGQRGVQGETEQVEDAVSEEQAAKQAENAAAAMEGLKDAAKALREAMEAVNGEPMHAQDKAALDNLAGQAKAVEKAVEEGNLAEAKEGAEALAKGAGALREEVGESESREADEARGEGLREGMGQLGEGQSKAEALAEEIGKTQPGPGEGTSPGSKREMERLGKRQGQLGEQVDKLGEMLKELDAEMPGIEGE